MKDNIINKILTPLVGVGKLITYLLRRRKHPIKNNNSLDEHKQPAYEQCLVDCNYRIISFHSVIMCVAIDEEGRSVYIYIIAHI